MICYCRSVGVSGETFCSPNPSYFSSSEGSHAGVEAYIKARQGHLYPLPTGLCFLESVRIKFDFLVTMVKTPVFVTSVPHTFYFIL